MNFLNKIDALVPPNPKEFDITRQTSRFLLTLGTKSIGVSTAGLLNHLYLGMHNKNKLFRVSPVILKASSFLIGKSNLYKKLSDSLVVDSSKAYKILGWQPPINLEQGLQFVAKNYYKKKDF